MNILITGGAGYIGSHIAEKLVQQKYQVVIIDNLITGYKRLINKKSVFFKSDINNKKNLFKIIKRYKIQTIIHLAAYLNVSDAEKNKKKYYKNNVMGTKTILETCKNNSVKNFIFSSSCSVYGNVNGAVSEERKLKPSGYYAQTKLQAEKLVIKYSKKYKLKFGILRYFNVAGASETGKCGEIEKSHGHLIKNLAIQSLKKKPQIKIYGNDYKTKDGTCVRDYIHVSDLTNIHLKSLEYLNNKKKSFTLNCGYGKGYSVKEIVNIFKKIKKRTIVTYSKRRPGDVDKVYANNSKIKKILKWKPKYNNIQQIINSAIRWEKKI